MRRTVIAAALASALSLGATAARAQAQGGSVEQAKMFFTAGATAYSKGDFRAAIQAFEEAHKLAPRPAILFSMAQAYKRQYFVDRRPEDLRRAVDLYKQYVADVQQGGRRGDAVQALSELEPMLQRGGGDAAAGPAPAPAPPKVQTRVMVSSSVKEAKVSLDGAAPVELPLIEEVKPGKHKVRVTAEGYFDEEREVLAVEGNLIPNDISLREKPARVTITAPNGAQISVDGRPQATTPLGGPLEIPPGRHLVAVTKNGSRAFTQQVDLERGEAKKIEASLSITPQRVVSYGLMGIGVAGIAVGAVATAITLREQNTANAVLASREEGNITREDLDTYNAARTARDEWRKVIGAGFGVGGAFAVTGLLLYAFDQPAVDVGSLEPEQRKKKTTDHEEPSMEMSAVPAVGPGFAGAGLVGRF